MTYRGRTDVHTTAELEAAAGVTYRQLRRWVVAGLLAQPLLHSRGRGKGVVALWSSAALQHARRIGELRRQGHALDWIRHLIATENVPGVKVAKRPAARRRH